MASVTYPNKKMFISTNWVLKEMLGHHPDNIFTYKKLSDRSALLLTKYTVKIETTFIDMHMEVIHTSQGRPEQGAACTI